MHDMAVSLRTASRIANSSGEGGPLTLKSARPDRTTCAATAARCRAWTPCGSCPRQTVRSLQARVHFGTHCVFRGRFTMGISIQVHESISLKGFLCLVCFQRCTEGCTAG